MSLLLQLESKLFPNVNDTERKRIRTTVLTPLIELLFVKFDNKKGEILFNKDLLLADPETLKILLGDFLEKKSMNQEEFNILSSISDILKNQDEFLGVTKLLEQKLFDYRYISKYKNITPLLFNISTALSKLTGGLTGVIELLENAIKKELVVNIDNDNIENLLENLNNQLIKLDINNLTNLNESNSVNILELPFINANKDLINSWVKVRNTISRSQMYKNLDSKWERIWNELDKKGFKKGIPIEKNQQVLITAYHLIISHLQNLVEVDDVNWDPKIRWGSCEKGRQLLHFISDKLTGYKGLKPIMDFNDQTLIKFGKSISKLNKHKYINDLHLSGFITSIKMAKSKTEMNNINETTKIHIIVPMGNEGQRILPQNIDLMGQDALRTKISQINWLFSDNPNIKVNITFIDDGDPSGSGEIAKSILINEYNENYKSNQTGNFRFFSLQEIIDRNNKLPVNLQNPVLSGLYNAETDSIKGGSTVWGMYEAAKSGADIVLFTDFDLTYPLEETGKLITKLMKDKNVGVVIGSRRLDDSYGYYLNEGPNVTATLYASAVKELLNLNFINDPQAGFKAFRGSMLLEILPKVKDRGLSFDTELLLLTSLSGLKVTEVGVSSLHKYDQNNFGVERNYEQMLKKVEAQAKWHGQKPLNKQKTMTYIRENGGFNNTVSLLEKQSESKIIQKDKAIEIVDVKKYS